MKSILLCPDNGCKLFKAVSKQSSVFQDTIKYWNEVHYSVPQLSALAVNDTKRSCLKCKKYICLISTWTYIQVYIPHVGSDSRFGSYPKFLSALLIMKIQNRPWCIDIVCRFFQYIEPINMQIHFWLWTRRNFSQCLKKNARANSWRLRHGILSPSMI